MKNKKSKTPSAALRNDSHPEDVRESDRFTTRNASQKNATTAATFMNHSALHLRGMNAPTTAPSTPIKNSMKKNSG